MQININADHTIERHQGLDDHVQEVVRGALGRFGEHITSVEVHVSNELAEKLGDGENRCMMEARITGYKPVAVSDHDATLHQAVNGAAEKLKRAIDSALGRLNDRKHITPAKFIAADDALSAE
jgi:ribosome-associated translation inhibitor RaiA